jgi:hypothetical protein
MRTRRSLFTAIVLAVGSLGPAADAGAVVIVAPNSLAAVEGNSNNGFPFNILSHGRSEQRYQQVFAASEFSALAGPHRVTQIAFRPDDQSGLAFASTLPNVQINLSTTAAAPDGLSNFFANNVGSDDTVVFSGPLSISSADVGGPPRAFDIVITFPSLFVYDPALGNLLLDVRNFGGGGSTQFDFVVVTGDSTSRLFSPDDVTAPGGSLDTGGLVAQFTFEPVGADPVPEPGTLLLVGTGVLGLLLRRRRQAHRF